MRGLANQVQDARSAERAVSVAAFTGGQSVPSARFRVRQYLNLLNDEAIIVREFPARTSAYPPANKLSRPFWAGSALLSRAMDLVDARHCDITLLQREFLSTFMTLEGLTRSPRVLDVDDAIFLHRGGGFAQRLAKACDLVICGNDFLAESFSKWASRIEIIPTAVDPTRYLPRESRGSSTSDDIVLGWIGTSGNYRFLRTIESALACVLADKPGVRLLVVADAAPDLPSIPAEKLEFRRWTEASEITDIQSMDIGLMPLVDSAWARGKCSFKMLQYMSCAIPVVVSPVGMNQSVLARGQSGISADSSSEWTEALSALIADSGLRRRMGQTGRQVIEQFYSTQLVAAQLAGALRSVI
jgi:glycosyltransferase involved in cell wall biosynthesis